MKTNKLLLLALVVVVALGLGLLAAGQTDSAKDKVELQQASPSQAPSAINTKLLSAGQKAPEFQATTIDGVDLILSSLAGKVVVITSGAAWCPTCIIENKNFEPVYQEVKDKGVEFITVDIDPIDTIAAVREFQQTYAPWHNVHVSQAGKLINDYGFWRFEITYIIDGNGIVRFADSRITSTNTLFEELNKLI